MLYLAPIQGFTDFIYRKTYASYFEGIDRYFIPYITTKNDKLPSKYQKETKPKHNLQKNVVPQVLARNTQEIILLTNHLLEQGYSEINWNLGCPYPMATNKKRGAGLLPYPNEIEQILEDYFARYTAVLSIKMRVGLHSEKEIEKLIPVLNKFPISEVILHPRTAKQLYVGNISIQALEHVCNTLDHRLIYNGDILTPADAGSITKRYPQIQGLMLGRGVLKNPFLPEEINNSVISKKDRSERLIGFHNQLLKEYLDFMDNEGNAVNKMKIFWTYFSHNFENRSKVFKGIRKTKKLKDYLSKVQNVFAQHD